MIDQGQSQSQLPQERLSATEIGLLTRRAEPAAYDYTPFHTHPQGRLTNDNHDIMNDL
jgi:hypothetical protein